MKNVGLILGFGVLTILGGCKDKEEATVKKLEVSTSLDTSWIKTVVSPAQIKQVLLENITGVKCTTAGEAAKIASDLSEGNPGRINIISIHPDLPDLHFFCTPINDPDHTSKYDFRTSAGSAICSNSIGIPNSLPKGAINRIKFTDQTTILTDRSLWTAKVNDELAVPTPVNINLVQVTEINGKPLASNEIWIDVTLEYTQVISDKHYLTMALVEDSLIDVQEYADYSLPVPVVGYNNNFVHMNILRDVMTPSTGDLINKSSISVIPGRVFLKRYKYTAKDPLWKRKQLHAVVYVHQNSGDKTVLQSNHIKLHL